jgi:hypothetical protein
MMRVMPDGRGARFLLIGVAFAALLAVGVGVAVHAIRSPGADVVDESTHRPGWKTIEYEDVHVDIPGTWERLDRGDCDLEFERWGPLGSHPCEPDGAGVAFFVSETFDPAHGPGVRNTERPGSGSLFVRPAESADWGGYVRAGDFAVYASDDDRAVVDEILGSAR